MQTTLLGLAIAIILALLAALVGPLLIDWGGYRSLFEAEASRLIGVDVRVTGADRGAAVAVAAAHAARHRDRRAAHDKVRARSLGFEFALGPLMRGEWRAAEMHLVGPQLSLGLDCVRPCAGAESGDRVQSGQAVDRPVERRGWQADAHRCGERRPCDARTALVQRRGALAARPVQGRGRRLPSAASFIRSGSPPAAIATTARSSFMSMSIRSIVRSASKPTACWRSPAARRSFDGTLSLARPVGIASRGAQKTADVKSALAR